MHMYTCVLVLGGDCMPAAAPAKQKPGMNHDYSCGKGNFSMQLEMYAERKEAYMSLNVFSNQC